MVEGAKPTVEATYTRHEPGDTKRTELQDPEDVEETRRSTSQATGKMTRNHSQTRDFEDTRRGSREPRGKRQARAPLVSVVIPCYNQAHFLGEAVESVL